MKKPYEPYVSRSGLHHVVTWAADAHHSYRVRSRHAKSSYVAFSVSYKNSSGDEIVNVLVNDDIAHT